MEKLKVLAGTLACLLIIALQVDRKHLEAAEKAAHEALDRIETVIETLHTTSSKVLSLAELACDKAMPKLRVEVVSEPNLRSLVLLRENRAYCSTVYGEYQLLVDPGNFFNLRLRSGLRSGYAAVFTQDGLVAADARHKVARQANQLVVGIEVNAYTLLQTLTAARLDAVQIIPAVGVEGVSEQRVAHDKPHLLAGHSRPQLVYHVLRDDIALLNVDFINPGE